MVQNGAKTILVTGGAGFIGSNFIKLVLKKMLSAKIVNFDKLTYAGNLANLDDVKNNANYLLVKGDIADAKDVRDAFEKHSPDVVVNFAAESHVDRSINSPGEFIQTNINGTFTLLEAARVFWRDDYSSKKFVHISTDEVFGSLKFDEPAFTEKSIYKPNSPYSASKAASDHLVRAYNKTYGIQINITNCSNNYGPYQFPEKLIPVTILSIVGNKPIPVYGKGENVRDWIYVEDHNRAVLDVIAKGKNGETYNVGSCNEMKNIDIVNLICEICDKKMPHKKGKSSDLIKYVTDRPGHDLRYAIDSSKIKKELGWQPEYTFEQALEKTVEWYLENLSWVEDIIRRGSSEK